MTIQEVRQDTNYKVTIDQIRRLERGLLAMRESAEGSPDVLNTIARIQYQEIARLRSELDVAMGFAEEASDLVVALTGPHVRFGVVPSSVIAATLNNVRGAVQSVSAYLATGQFIRRGRYPESLSRLADFEFVGAANGSVRIKLNLPEPRSLFPEYDREPIERGVQLLLQTVGWVSSNADIDELEQSTNDERLVRLLLTQVHRVIPPRNGIVQRIEFSGRLTSPGNRYTLSHTSVYRVSDALNEVSTKEARVVETGKLRSVDIDKGAFELRQRPDDRPNLPCDVAEGDLLHALEYLVQDVTVTVVGIQEFDKRGWPSRLKVEDIYEA